jgi:hypothetical protein
LRDATEARVRLDRPGLKRALPAVEALEQPEVLLVPEHKHPATSRRGADQLSDEQGTPRPEVIRRRARLRMGRKAVRARRRSARDRATAARSARAPQPVRREPAQPRSAPLAAAASTAGWSLGGVSGRLAVASRLRKAPSSWIVLISGAGNMIVEFLSTPISTMV